MTVQIQTRGEMYLEKTWILKSRQHISDRRLTSLYALQKEEAQEMSKTQGTVRRHLVSRAHRAAARSFLNGGLLWIEMRSEAW